jgi:DNA-binding winged helix-turn-helix (wHTH) protein
VSPATGKVVQFGPFEADLRTSELRKHGIRVRLGGQPSQVLAALLEHPGEIVTREELRRRLWPGQTFVEFQTGLNSAVRKLRLALGDPAGKAVYVETLPRMGYRFMAPIQYGGNGAGPASADAAAVYDDLPPAVTKDRVWNRWRSWGVAAGVFVLGFVAYGFLSPVPVPHVTDFLQTPLTDHLDGFGRIVTDGVRVYFLEREGNHDNLVQTSTAGNTTTRIDAPFSEYADIRRVPRRIRISHRQFHCAKTGIAAVDLAGARRKPFARGKRGG